MAIAIEPYKEHLIPAVKSFNMRLGMGGVSTEFRFPEHHIPQWLPKLTDRSLYQELFLALENGSVHGGYILKHQEFFVRGIPKQVAYYHLPLSEGVVNKRHATVGVHMLRHALREQPLLFALGMGSFDRPLPRMLKSMGWSTCALPFYFRANHPNRLLRELRALRNTAWRARLLDLSALTGVGWLGLTVLQNLRAGMAYTKTRAELIDEFSDWTDELLENCRNRYAMLARRDHENLNILYPPGSKFLRLRVTSRGKVVGWAVLLDTQMKNHRYFGNLRVGSIVDNLALPENAVPVIAAANEFLSSRGADVIVSNQSHGVWCTALKMAGFLQGPSNFIFAASRALSGMLAPFAVNCAEIHFNRGDGDGPINL